MRVLLPLKGNHQTGKCLSRLLFVFILLVGVCQQVNAQSATINSAYWDLSSGVHQWSPAQQRYVYGYVYHFHINMDIRGMAGEQAQVFIFFEQPKGVDLQDTNDRYCSGDDGVCSFKKVSISSNNAHLENCVVSIPACELEGLDNTEPFYCNIMVHDGSDFICDSFYLKVDKNSRGSSSVDNGGIQKDETCYHCYNSRKCSNCGGRGYVYNPVGKGSYAECYSCNGSGRCRFCR